MEIGRSFETSSLWPCLYIGITLAVFNSTGTTLVFREQLKISDSGSAINSIPGDINVDLMPSSPVLWVCLRVRLIAIISEGEVGIRAKESILGGLRKVELGILEGGILFTRSCATPVKYLLNCSAIDWLSVILRPLKVSWDIFESGGLSRRIVLIVCQVCLRSSLNLVSIIWRTAWYSNLSQPFYTGI